MRTHTLGPSLKSLVSLVCAALASAGAAFASPTLITFDDLLGWPWPNPYNGLTWNNFFPEYVPSVTGEFGPSGYQAGMISSGTVAFNSGGSPASITRSGAFDFNSAYMTSALMDGLQLEVRGLSNGNLKYDHTWILSATAPSFINFNYLGVTEVDLITFGGTPHGYWDGASGEQFAMDNLTVNLTPVPEPDVFALILVGAVALTFVSTRKRPVSQYSTP